MKLGVALPHFGPHASPEAIIAVARKAESLGFSSLWVLERLLWPATPASRYPGNPRGEMPMPMRITFDPLTVLSFVAAHTERISLGTSVLVAANRSPAVTAKMIATLDVLSAGRVIMGLGTGWSADEFVAVGRGIEERNQQADEFIELVRTLWQSEEVQFSGKYYRVPRAVFLPKPVQSHGPPIWIGGNSDRALRRVAAYGDGWHPTSRMPLTEMTEKFAAALRLADERGRDPAKIILTLRWNAFPDLREVENRSAVKQKLLQYRAAKVTHICIDLNIPNPIPPELMIETMERLAEDILPSL